MYRYGAMSPRAWDNRITGHPAVIALSLIPFNLALETNALVGGQSAIASRCSARISASSVIYFRYIWPMFA